MNHLEKFKDVFEPELIQVLEDKATYKAYKAGETIIEIGQMVRFIPIILDGNIKVVRTDEDGNELLLYYVNSQESCAMSFTCCMQNFPSEIRAIAEDDIKVLMVPNSFMDEWMMKYPTWKSFVMQTIHSRFNELLKAIDQIAFQKLDERLVHYLKEKSRTIGSALINLSHEQIANDLATSRVVISRLLKKLENDKKLLLYRNQIKLLSSM